METLNMITTPVRARRFSPTDDAGATTAEYSLLAALVAGICIAALTGFGNQISTLFNTLAGNATVP
jgi:pilus assembly protein Flp/PilA